MAFYVPSFNPTNMELNELSTYQAYPQSFFSLIFLMLSVIISAEIKKNPRRFRPLHNEHLQQVPLCSERAGGMKVLEH